MKRVFRAIGLDYVWAMLTDARNASTVLGIRWTTAHVLIALGLGSFMFLSILFVPNVMPVSYGQMITFWSGAIMVNLFFQAVRRAWGKFKFAIYRRWTMRPPAK